MIKYVFLVIILLSVYALMVFALSRMNLIRPYRFLQMRYVFASAAYSLIMSIAFIFMLGAIDMIMSVDAINRIVLEGVPSTSYSAAFMLLITLFGNILFMLGAVIVSAVCKKISREKTEYSDSAIETWLEGIAERFYNIDSEEGIPFIRPEHILSAKWMNSVRKIILALFIIFVCLSCMKLYSGVGFSSKFLLKILKYVFIIISAAYYPIAEVFYFLDGPEKREDLVEFDIDEIGLDALDKKLLETLIVNYQGKPVGIETLATTLGEEISTIEDVYEPYLIQIGFISRTPRGRIAMPAAYKHLGYEIK